MDNPLPDVAAAVELELKRTPFTLPSVKEWSYADWDLPLEDGDNDLRVDIVPVSPLGVELYDRGSSKYSPACDVVIRQRFVPENYDPQTKRINRNTISELVKLVCGVHDFLVEVRLTGMPEAVWKETRILAAYKPSHLRNHHQFTGVVRVTFDVPKALPPRAQA